MPGETWRPGCDGEMRDYPVQRWRVLRLSATAQSPRAASKVFARFSRGSRDDGAGASGQKRASARGRRSGSAPPTNTGAPPSSTAMI